MLKKCLTIMLFKYNNINGFRIPNTFSFYCLIIMFFIINNVINIFEFTINNSILRILFSHLKRKYEEIYISKNLTKWYIMDDIEIIYILLLL